MIRCKVLQSRKKEHVLQQIPSRRLTPFKKFMIGPKNQKSEKEVPVCSCAEVNVINFNTSADVKISSIMLQGWKGF